MTPELPTMAEIVDLEPAYAAELASVAGRFGSELWKKIDALESELEALPPAFQEALPLNHLLPDGVYVRQCFMRKGLIVTTRVHLVEHVFNVLFGVVSVLNDEGQWETFRAGHTGVTKPGTRRVLVVHEDCIWQTVHPNPGNETDPDEIVRNVTFTGGKYAQLGIAAMAPEGRLSA